MFERNAPRIVAEGGFVQIRRLRVEDQIDEGNDEGGVKLQIAVKITAMMAVVEMKTITKRKNFRTSQDGGVLVSVDVRRIAYKIPCRPITY